MYELLETVEAPMTKMAACAICANRILCLALQWPKRASVQGKRRLIPCILP